MEIRIDLVAGASRHRLGVELRFGADELPEADPELFLPVWTPGSYLVREYSRHLSAVQALDSETEEPRQVRKTRKNRYVVQHPGGRGLVVRYEVYAHSLTVREAWVGEEFAFWNGACAYLWPVGRPNLTAEIHVALPAGWRLYAGTSVEHGTGRVDRDGSACFTVDGLDHAVDTPCLAMPDARVISFEALGVPFRYVCAGLGPVVPPVERLVEDTRKVVQAAAEVFSDQPSLPCEEYTFLSLFDAAGRGGLEHLNSSTLLAPRTVFGNEAEYRDFVSLVAHEFFHVWNVKRMRPVEFHEFDYEQETLTELLWVAEGFTAYYDDLLCLRAGVMTTSQYLAILAKHVANARRMPGRFAQSLSESSYDAWIRFYRQDENTRNSTQNYYSNGALAALCLDTRIRVESGGARCLDDAVRALWGKTLAQGYTYDDVVAAVSEAAGVDLSELVEQLVRGSFDPDFESVLGEYGLRLVPKSAGFPTLGLQFERGTLRLATVLDGGASARAGLAAGDEILGVGGLRVTLDNWTRILGQLSKAGAWTVLVSRDGILRTFELEPDRTTPGSYTIEADASADESKAALRKLWVGDV